MSQTFEQPESNDEEMTVTLDLEDGSSVECAIVTILTVNNQDYIVLLPLDENGENEDGEVWFYRYSENEDDPNEEPVLDYIDDDDEYIRVAVIGKPNAGKSSLINKILGEERLIVSNIAGTTRDAIDTPFENEYGKYIFIDTAGIRETDDVVEKIGVQKSLESAENADLRIYVLDNREKLDNDTLEFIKSLKDKKLVL